MQADITRCVELGPSSRRRESRSYYRMHLYIRVFELYVAAIDIPHSVTRPPRAAAGAAAGAVVVPRRVGPLRGCVALSLQACPLSTPSRLSESRTQRFWVLGSYVAVGSRDPSCGHGSRAPDTSSPPALLPSTRFTPSAHRALFRATRRTGRRSSPARYLGVDIRCNGSDEMVIIAPRSKSIYLSTCLTDGGRAGN